ncbi:hypothetical protein [Streptomyces canus]|uniref:hypothetical protein n=1 Tax=Streptomyces canus TaxID=58343 RepID=UPI002E363138|nr:hypothetical protein [Streptomyces canus]
MAVFPSVQVPGRRLSGAGLVQGDDVPEAEGVRPGVVAEGVEDAAEREVHRRAGGLVPDDHVLALAARVLHVGRRLAESVVHASQ